MIEKAQIYQFCMFWFMGGQIIIFLVFFIKVVFIDFVVIDCNLKNVQVSMPYMVFIDVIFSVKNDQKVHFFSNLTCFDIWMTALITGFMVFFCIDVCVFSVSGEIFLDSMLYLLLIDVNFSVR